MNVEPKIKTEDTGKIFEKAICLAYGIDYDGPYKYSLETATQLAQRLKPLVSSFPKPTHTAARGARYDFTADPETHLSAKSTKAGVGKVAPQVVGQSQPQKFCNIIGIPFTTPEALKEYIQTNIQTILPVLVSYTFDCPNIYYNKEQDSIRYITLTTPIDWTRYKFTWTCDWSTWSNSSTLKVVSESGTLALVEFQFHTKSRTNMAVRWCYENFLTLFADHLTVISM